MMKLLLAAAIALSASVAMSAERAPAAKEDGKTAQPTRQAKAKFLKKCIRNVTSSACNAPPEARVSKRANGA